MDIKDLKMSRDDFEFLKNMIIVTIEPKEIRKLLDTQDEMLIEYMKTSPACVKTNGFWEVNWGYCEKLNGFNLSDEQQRQYDEARAECEKISDSIYVHNRINAIKGKIY